MNTQSYPTRVKSTSLFTVRGLAESDVPRYLSLLPDKLRSAHPKRQRSWVLGRLALSAALQDLDVKIDVMSEPTNGPQRFLRHPDYRFTISHTDDIGACWAAKSTAALHGFGLDIERTDRPFSKDLRQRFRTADDETSLSDGAIWSAKEAVFKCLPTAQQTGLNFSTILIQSPTNFALPSENLSGSLELIEGPVQSLMALAWLS